MITEHSEHFIFENIFLNLALCYLLFMNLLIIFHIQIHSKFLMLLYARKAWTEISWLQYYPCELNARIAQSLLLVLGPTDPHYSLS